MVVYAKDKRSHMKNTWNYLIPTPGNRWTNAPACSWLLTKLHRSSYGETASSRRWKYSKQEHRKILRRWLRSSMISTHQMTEKMRRWRRSWMISTHQMIMQQPKRSPISKNSHPQLARERRWHPRGSGFEKNHPFFRSIEIFSGTVLHPPLWTLQWFHSSQPHPEQ